MSQARNVVLILGMHRSGTSCLTGCLQEAGLLLGEVVQQNADNRKGNRENREIMALQDGLLEDNGASWKDPPNGAVVWSAARFEQRDRIVAGYPTDRLWGFKDPRTVFTLDGWLGALPDPILIGSIRHPLAVAASLASRNGFSTERGLDLWLAYNRRLLDICNARPVQLISFDWDWPRYDRKLRVIAASLGLTAPQSFVFREAELRNNNANDVPLPSAVDDVYRALQGHLTED